MTYEDLMEEELEEVTYEDDEIFSESIFYPVDNFIDEFIQESMSGSSIFDDEPTIFDALEKLDSFLQLDDGIEQDLQIDSPDERYESDFPDFDICDSSVLRAEFCDSRFGGANTDEEIELSRMNYGTTDYDSIFNA